MGKGSWSPTEFREFGRRVKTSMLTCQITTDAGPAYIKCLGNPTGPHALACDWIGSRFADLMGMQTLDFAILNLTSDDAPFTGGKEESGPAFVTREEDGEPWSGFAQVLALIKNPHDFAKLVVLDTLLLNRDRHSAHGTIRNRDNVFISDDPKRRDRPCLIAMDFSHAISFGNEIDVVLNHRDRTRDDEVYGLFDAFCPFITNEYATDAIESLGRITDSKISEVIGELPREWQIDEACRRALRTFLPARRDYLMGTLFERLSLAAGHQTSVEEDEDS